MASIFERNRPLLVGGIVLSILLAVLAGYIEMRKAQARTQEAVKREASYIQDQLAVVGANMRAVVALISSSNAFKPVETDRFLSLLHTPLAQKRWLWVERVPAADLSRFEADQRNRGASNFTVFQLSAAGTALPVNGRDVYYPVVYDFREGNTTPSQLLGFDLSSFLAGTELLGSFDSRVSQPLAAPQNAFLGNQLLFSLAVPTSAGFDTDPRGLVVRPITVSELLPLAGTPRQRSIAEISDVTDSASPLLLFGRADAAGQQGEDMPVDNRIWRVSIASEPPSSFLLVPATILTLGLLLTALLLAITETSGTQAQARDLLLQLDRQKSDLRHTEDVYRSLFDNAGTANCETDPFTGHILKANDRMCELFGYSREELLDMSLLDVTHPNDRQASIDMLNAIAAGGHDTLTIDKRYLRKDGTAFWALKTTRLINDAAGRPTACTTVIQDISQRKADEQAKARLLRELAHRVRNTVQLMASLADQTAKSAVNVESYRRNFQNRLRALKAAQDLLFEAEWRNVGLVELATSTLAPFQSGDQKTVIHVSLPPIELPTQHAQTLAIAFHELGSNAIQHGALSRPGGIVELKGIVEKGAPDDVGEGVLVMSWEEANGPAVVKPKRRGFGRVMLERVLASQFGGTTEIEWLPSGMKFKARLPLADLETDTLSSVPFG